MNSASVLIVLAALAVLAGMSLIANRRLAARSRLPMQWSLSGEVNWTAARWVALSFTPALAALTLGVVAASSTAYWPCRLQHWSSSPLTACIFG